MSAELTLKFESEKRLDKEGEEVKDQFDAVVYDQNDIQALDYLLMLIDSNKIGRAEWLTLLSVIEKVQERYRAEDFDCEIEFSPKEYAFLQKFLEKPESKLRKDQRGGEIPLGTFHLFTWRDLNAQFNGKADD